LLSFEPWFWSRIIRFVRRVAYAADHQPHILLKAASVRRKQRVDTIHRIPTIFLSVITFVLPRGGRMRNQQLMEVLSNQLDREEHETETYARKVRETNHSVVKVLYAKLMRDSMQHADVLNCAIAYLAASQWKEPSQINESREEILRLMDVEEKALRLFTFSSTQVSDPHLRSLLTMLALDEEEHYALLRYVLENFVDKRETVEA
jgi:rubrerythrin